MKIVIDKVEYLVTPEQVRKAFGIIQGYADDAIDEGASKLIKSLTPAPKRGRPAGASTFDLKKAQRLRKQNKTYKEIGDALGCSSRPVIRKLKEAE